MYVVIFKAISKTLDQEYLDTAAELRVKALTEYGCLNFEAVTEGKSEIALSYWSSLEDIQRWKQNELHLRAQQHGAQHWYDSYTVEIAKVERSYSQ